MIRRQADKQGKRGDGHARRTVMKSVRDAEHKPNRQNFYGWKKTAGMRIGGRAGEREGATRRCRDESGPVRVHEGGALWRWLVSVPSCAVLPGLGVEGRGILCREGSAERNRRGRASERAIMCLYYSHPKATVNRAKTTNQSVEERAGAPAAA